MKSLVEGKDKLKNTHLWIATKDTWQGMITGNGYTSKIPPMITGDLNTGQTDLVLINLEENIWNYQSGIEDFSKCFNRNEKENCLSIFDPRSNSLNFRYPQVPIV